MICLDCGMNYEVSPEDHDNLCEAKTCSLCMVTYEKVVPVNSYGERVCRECREIDGMTDGDYSSEEESEDL